VFTARYALNSYVKKDVPLLGAFTKFRKATLNFVMFVCPSVCPHGKTRLPLGRIKRNFIGEYFSKISQVSVKSDKNNVRSLYPKTDVQFLPYFAHFLLL